SSDVCSSDLFWNRRCKNKQGLRRRFLILRGQQSQVILVDDINALIDQRLRQIGLGFVVPFYLAAQVLKIASQPTHSYPADPKQVNPLYMIQIHHLLINFNTSFAITSSASSIASDLICVPNSKHRLSSANRSSTVSTSVVRALVSATRTAARLATSACAFFVWWSSATLGEGTSTTGFPTAHNSDIVPAPALEITRSAAAYA